jgi:hypothetical protein
MRIYAPQAKPSARILRPGTQMASRIPGHRSGLAASVLRLQRTEGNQAVLRRLGAATRRPRPREIQRQPHGGGSGSNAVPFPGDYVPGYAPLPFIGQLFNRTYTEDDRALLLKGLKDRVNLNRTRVAKFLGTYVKATIDIWGRYVTSEMSDAAAKAKSGLASQLLRFIVAESIATLAGGGVGRFLKPLAGAAAAKILGALTNKVTSFTGSLVSGSAEQDLLDADLKKRKAALEQINESLAAGTGAFVEAGVESLKDDSLDRATWLAKAPLSDLHLFRVPEEIPSVDESLIRSVVAGVIAAKAHQHDADKPCDSIGLQCGINETVPKGSIGELDDNVIKIGLRASAPEPHVNYIRFFSASPVLAKELARKAKLSMVPHMALRIEVDRGDAGLAAGAILAAAGSSTHSDPEEEDRFAKRYDELLKKSARAATFAVGPTRDITLLTRHPEEGLRIAGLGLAEALWLYELASGDGSLNALAGSIERRHLYEQEHVVSDAPEPVSTAPSATRLAELAHTVIEPMLVTGLEKLIAEHLGGLTLPDLEPKGRRVAR